MTTPQTDKAKPRDPIALWIMGILVLVVIAFVIIGPRS